VAWVFTARPLVFLGQHSLHVFSFHVLVYYALAQFAPSLGLGEFGNSLLLIAAVASLWLAAWGHAWLQARDAARADDAASAAVRR
jgi:peptidoglycan/LPS O-acetylase OafA/YrhL